MASRRAFASTALRAAAQSISRPARPAFAIASRTQLVRPALVNNNVRAWAVRRWYSSDGVELDSRVWNFEDVKKYVETREGADNIVIVDVREPVELFETGKIPGAINIPITSAVQSFHISEEDFEDMYGFERPAKDKELMFYCKAGVRARAAAGLAKHAGWDKVGEYPGSWLDWEKQQGPVEKLKGRVDQGIDEGKN